MRMRDVTETNGGWLAVGEEDQPCEILCPTAARAVVWTSADGIRWTQEPAPPSLANAVMTGVTRGGPGYVAVGQSLPMPISGVVWTSADGQSWSRVADAPVFHAPPGTDQTFGAVMHAVTVGKDGILVAVGRGSRPRATSGLRWPGGPPMVGRGPQEPATGSCMASSSTSQLHKRGSSRPGPPALRAAWVAYGPRRMGARGAASPYSQPSLISRLMRRRPLRTWKSWSALARRSPCREGGHLPASGCDRRDDH